MNNVVNIDANTLSQHSALLLSPFRLSKDEDERIDKTKKTFKDIIKEKLTLSFLLQKKKM